MLILCENFSLLSQKTFEKKTRGGGQTVRLKLSNNQGDFEFDPLVTGVIDVARIQPWLHRKILLLCLSGTLM